LRERVAMLAVLVGAGSIGLVPTWRAMAAAKPQAASTGPRLVTVSGSPLADVVADATGHAFASSPSRDEVVVIDLAAGTLETPIAVGRQPAGLALSPDGGLLYVANRGAHDISVVDVASRRETHRIPVPPGPYFDDRPLSVAVAGNAKVLVSTITTMELSSRVVEIDLPTEAAQARTDFNRGQTSGAVRLAASGDHSRIALVATGSGTVVGYDAAIDAFDSEHDLNDGVEAVALDRTGRRILVEPRAGYLSIATAVLDTTLALRAMIPGPGGKGIAAGPSSAAYRVRDATVDVLDLDRQLVAATMDLPEAVGPATGAVAVSSDGETLAVLTASGVSLVPVSSAAGVRCSNQVTGSAPGPLAVRFCDAPLADVAVDATSHAFASNPGRNQVEVLDLRTGVAEAPILVGSQPKGVALSPDGRTLYVANSGAQEISVVDVALRRETRRIDVPPPAHMNLRPTSIAVASNGKALVATAAEGSDGRLVEVDLATTVITQSPNAMYSGKNTVVEASGDHTRIGVAMDQNTAGALFVYDATADSFTERDLGFPTHRIALDRTGSVMLTDDFAGTETMVLDAVLGVRGSVPGRGAGQVVAPSGGVTYRVHENEVDVINLSRKVVAATIDLPRQAGMASGAAALSPDGSQLVLATALGMSVTPVSAAVAVSCETHFFSRPPPPGSTPVCGMGPLDEVVVDVTDHAFASNPSRNQIEVLDLRTGALEAPIAVGSQPMGLDLGPDGSTLYVADSGASEVSVVDVAGRRETHRIDLPGDAKQFDAPLSIAVAGNGKALVSTAYEFGDRIQEIDLATEAVRVRHDLVLGPEIVRSPPAFSHRMSEVHLAPSGDRSRVVGMAKYLPWTTPSSDVGPVFSYDTSTDAFSTVHDVKASLGDIAVDRTGTQVMLDGGRPNDYDLGTIVLDRDLALRTRIPEGGISLAFAPSGTTVYRGRGHWVDVIDATGLSVTGRIDMPDYLGARHLAVSADGAYVVASVDNGFVVLDPRTAVPTPPTTTTTTTTTSTTTTPPPSTTTSAPPRPTTSTTAPPPAPTGTARSGYWMLGAGGSVYPFGDARSWGDASALLPAGHRAVDVEPTPSDHGYWVVDERGEVFAFGDASYRGGSPSLGGGEAVTSMSATPGGAGYWLFTNTGRVLAYGDAPFLGDMAGHALNGPVLGSVRTPSGRGYYMVASDGGIFSFGDAAFHGSMGDQRLNGPVVGLAPDPDGSGYWLVASDGGIFSFAAPFKGSMGAQRLNQPVIGMVAYGDGYLMVASDGGIFDFSSRPFRGSLGANPPARPVVAVAALGG